MAMKSPILGDMARQDSGNVDITGGSVSSNAMSPEVLTNISWNTLKLLELDGLTSPLDLTDSMRSMFEDETETDGGNTTAVYDSTNDYYDTKGHTAYDGDDDYHSSDAALKINGAQTWCLEINAASGESGNGKELLDNSTPTTKGMVVSWSNDSNLIQFTVGSTWNTSQYDLTALTDNGRDQWIKLVCVNRAGSHQLFVNGSGQTNQTSTFVVGDVDFKIGNTFTGNIRNVEVYSGAATDPENWVPGDTSSMSGVSLVMQSPDGSGTDNGQSISFSATGDPTITGATNGVWTSADQTAASAPDIIRVVLPHEFTHSGTMNTDLTVAVSRDGGTTYGDLTMSDTGAVSGSKKYYDGYLDVTSQPTGTTPKVKCAAANGVSSLLHGISIQWG